MVQGKDYIGVGCGAFILNEKNELLFLQRNREPERGSWSIPGGRLEMFETFEQAVKREVMEEIGVEIEIIDELGVCDHIIKAEEKHWVTVSFLSKITKGEPKNVEPDIHLDMKWFSLDNLPQNISIPAKTAVENYEKYINK